MSLEDEIKKMWEIDPEDLANYEKLLHEVISLREEEWLECEKEKRHLRAIEDYKLLFGETSKKEA